MQEIDAVFSRVEIDVRLHDRDSVSLQNAEAGFQPLLAPAFSDDQAVEPSFEGVTCV